MIRLDVKVLYENRLLLSPTKEENEYFEALKKECQEIVKIT
jgi:hypothetical protein